VWVWWMSRSATAAVVSSVGERVMSGGSRDFPLVPLCSVCRNVRSPPAVCASLQGSLDEAVVLLIINNNHV
jgi:hypothetical protein